MEVTVSGAGLPVGDHSVTVRVVAAQGLTIEHVVPQTVRLRISRP
jgi:hypothetical protein